MENLPNGWIKFTKEGCEYSILESTYAEFLNRKEPKLCKRFWLKPSLYSTKYCKCGHHPISYTGLKETLDPQYKTDLHLQCGGRVVYRFIPLADNQAVLIRRVS
jgi:hypothetical protein